MEFLFLGLEEDPNKDPYDALSELCTMLLVSEEGLVPLEPVTDTVLKALKKSPRDGDVQVMAARALALLLDKFTPSFNVFANRKGRGGSVTEGFKAIFALVSDSASAGKRTFTRTTQSELTEELLRCLTLGSSSTPGVRAVMPATDVQLRFCQASLDGSKWTSCKVLRHCALLARCGMLLTSTQRILVKEMLYQHLASLTALDVDYEWDELLRTVTEGIVTLRVWCADDEVVAGTSAPPKAARDANEVGRKKCKREREGFKDSAKVASRAQDHQETPAVEARAAQTTGKTTEEHFVDICERTCGNDGIAESRKELVLACASTVIRASAVAEKIPAEKRLGFLPLLLRLLQSSSEATLALSDPFARRDRMASDAEDEDGFKPLPNLQWEVPTLQWTALMLLAKFLGAEPETEPGYVWGWRGEGDLWYWYGPHERDLLTQAFFARRREVLLKHGEHQVNLLSMTDSHRPTRMVARIHFQPVPYQHRLQNTPLTEVYAAETLASGYGRRMTEVRQVLRALSFGISAAARLAKVVYLHAVCYAAPTHSEETKSAFRNLVGDCPVPALEALVQRLLLRDRAWATVLCDAGIADAIVGCATATASETDATNEGSARGVKRGRVERRTTGVAGRRSRRGSLEHGRTPSANSTPPLSARGKAVAGESPVVKLLRDASAAQQTPGSETVIGSATPTLAPLGLSLPHTTAEGLVAHLQSSSFSETVLTLQGLAATLSGHVDVSKWGPPPVTSTDNVLTELVTWLETDLEAKERIGGALISVFLRELQGISIEGKRRDLVDTVAEDVVVGVSLCDPESVAAESNEKEEDASGASRLRCPNGHKLKIHFSTNWQCNRCGQHTAYGSSACRQCNYDLCFECVEKVSNRIEVNPTATVADVTRAWLARHKPEGSTIRSALESSPSDVNTALGARDNAFCVFAENSLVPQASPAKVLYRMQCNKQALHCGRVFSQCVCGSIKIPATFQLPQPFALHGDTTLRDAQQYAAKVLAALVKATAAAVAADVGVVHALVEAVESRGSHIFLDGVDGLPRLVTLLLTSLRDNLPLALKRDMSKFLAIDCRRYALFHLQESGVFLRGTVQGEIGSNGLSTKIVVCRGKIDETTHRLYQAFGATPSLRNRIEFCFEGEEGTGNGPTQELYTELSGAFREKTNMWYVANEDGSNAAEEEGGSGTGVALGFPSCKALYWKHFFVLGAACARAFVDGYTMDIDVLPCVWSFLLPRSDEGLSATDRKWALLEQLDPALVRSYTTILKSSDAELEAMALEDEAGEPLTAVNAPLFVERAVSEHLEMGLVNLHAMHLGLLTSLDLSAMVFLSDEELTAVLCGGRQPLSQLRDGKLFTQKELRSVTLAAHGYSADSNEVDMFIQIVGGDFDAELQSYFLEFLTGSARLPLNGLAGLGRKITVVRKDMEGDASKQQTLPSCNTCFLYLKLPPYTTREVMRERLRFAITEGRKNFSLS